VSDLNFSDSQGEPIALAEDALNENIDLDAVDLDEAEVEAEHELDGFQIEEAPAAKAEEAESEDPYRKFRQELREMPGKWYVIHSYAGYERRVKQNIEVRRAALAGGDQVYQIEVPMEESIEIKNGQRKLVSKVRIPGYVLIRMEMTEDSWSGSPHPCGDRFRWQQPAPNSASPKRGI
jgi:transcriptional antiterminator NusG